MTKVLVSDAHLEDTGDAIREKLGVETRYTPEQFGPAIRSISGGGGGVGDMLKAVYDINENGIVDDSEKLEGHAASYFATTSALAGKMDKSIYDVNSNGIVDKATADKNGNDIVDTYAPILSSLMKKTSEETDADDITETGWYYFSTSAVASMTNLPVSGDGVLLIVYRQGSTIMFQFARGMSSDSQDFWMRSRTSSGWGDWMMIGRENDTPTWTAPTPYSSRCTVDSGGFNKTGNLVRVSMQLTSAYSRTQTTLATVQICSGLPTAERITPLICMNQTTGIMTPCYVNDLGALNLRLGAVNIASGDVLYISGEYIAS